MKLILTAAGIFLIFFSSAFSQVESHRWKSVSDNAKIKVWYDESFMDTLHTGLFNVWILKMYDPPLEFQEIKGRVFRSQILYAVNLNMMRYGMLKANYYGTNNKLIYNFDYPINDYPDSLKYTYPVDDNNILTKIIEQIRKKISSESGVTE